MAEIFGREAGGEVRAGEVLLKLRADGDVPDVVCAWREIAGWQMTCGE